MGIVIALIVILFPATLMDAFIMSMIENVRKRKFQRFMKGRRPNSRYIDKHFNINKSF